MFTVAGLPDAPPQPLDLDRPSPTLDEQAAARLALTASALPEFVGLDVLVFSAGYGPTAACPERGWKNVLAFPSPSR